MEELLQLLEHLVTSGPARNPSELEQLLGLIEAFRQHITPAQPSTPEPDPSSGPTGSNGGQL